MKPGAFRMVLAGMVAFAHTAGPEIGKAAVLLFFALSGYWISKMWQERYSGTESPYLTFTVSRLWRLLPMYWLCYLITVLIAGFTARLTPEQWALMQEPEWLVRTVLLLGSATQFRVLTSAWSLDYELQFYLLAPLLLTVVPRLRGGAANAGWVVCGGLALLYACGVHPWHPWVWHFMGFFGSGLMMQVSGWRPSAQMERGSLWAFSTAVLAVCLCFFLHRLGMWRSAPDFMVDLHSGRDAVLAVLGLPAALGSCHHASDAMDRALGAASYPLYLVQKFVDVFCEQMLLGKSLLWKTLSLPGQWLAMALITACLYYWVDGPLDRLRQGWVRRRSAAGVA